MSVINNDFDKQFRIEWEEETTTEKKLRLESMDNINQEDETEDELDTNTNNKYALNNVTIQFMPKPLISAPSPVKRGRGRPRKYPLQTPPTGSISSSPEINLNLKNSLSTTKDKRIIRSTESPTISSRGRTRKPKRFFDDEDYHGINQKKQRTKKRGESALQSKATKSSAKATKNDQSSRVTRSAAKRKNAVIASETLKKRKRKYESEESEESDLEEWDEDENQERKTEKNSQKSLCTHNGVVTGSSISGTVQTTTTSTQYTVGSDTVKATVRLRIRPPRENPNVIKAVEVQSHVNGNGTTATSGTTGTVNRGADVPVIVSSTLHQADCDVKISGTQLPATTPSMKQNQEKAENVISRHIVGSAQQQQLKQQTINESPPVPQQAVKHETAQVTQPSTKIERKAINPDDDSKHYYCKYCDTTWPLGHFRNSQQFGAHCSNCSRGRDVARSAPDGGTPGNKKGRATTERKKKISQSMNKIPAPRGRPRKSTRRASDFNLSHSFSSMEVHGVKGEEREENYKHKGKKRRVGSSSDAVSNTTTTSTPSTTAHTVSSTPVIVSREKGRKERQLVKINIGFDKVLERMKDWNRPRDRGGAAEARGLDQFPIAIVENVVLYLDCPQDLFQFMLTCKYFANVALLHQRWKQSFEKTWGRFVPVRFAGSWYERFKLRYMFVSKQGKPLVSKLGKDGEVEWLVEKIVASREEPCETVAGRSNYKTFYFVKWKGNDESHNSWVSEEDLFSEDLIKEFEDGFADKLEAGVPIEAKRVCRRMSTSATFLNRTRGSRGRTREEAEEDSEESSFDSEEEITLYLADGKGEGGEEDGGEEGENIPITAEEKERVREEFLEILKKPYTPVILYQISSGDNKLKKSSY